MEQAKATSGEKKNISGAQDLQIKARLLQRAEITQ